MQRWVMMLVFVLVPVFIIGTTVVLFAVQARHSAVLQDEAHAITTLATVNQANIVLDRQRLRVAESVYRPMDTALFRERADAFRTLMGNPNLLVTPESQRLQDDILQTYERFVADAVALPTRPTPNQVHNVQAQALRVVTLLDALRARHVADVEAILATEAAQRRLSTVLLLVTNAVVLGVVVLGFLLLVRLGRQQAETAALRATDQLRNEFVAFAAHELRNPASAIKTGASLLRDPMLDPDIRATVVESVNRSADALTRLVMTLLAMGRLEEGRLQLHREPTSLPTLVDALLDELALYHPGIKERVMCALPPVVVRVDAEYLKLAIANIMDNALKYAPPQSPITVLGHAEPDHVTVCIHNEGEGIPPERLPHIFEKYETSGTAPSSTRRGVGLGLYMARLLIEAHGGTIWAESTPGEGATMAFTLPVSAGPARE